MQDLTLQGLVTIVTSLVGAGAFIAGVVNALKVAGVVKDGQAPTAILIGNVILFVVVAGLKLFAPLVDVMTLDATAGTLAEILTLVLGLVVQLGASRLTHAGVLRGLPLIGKSHSL